MGPPISQSARTGRRDGMDRFSGVVAAIVVAMAIAVTVVLVGDGTPASKFEEDREWASHLLAVQTSLAAGQPQRAAALLRVAHRAAFRTGRWEAMVEVGDAARRASESAPLLPRGAAVASRAYLAGLALAREQGSLSGVLSVGEGFAALGDREMVEYCIGQAGELADRAGLDG